VLQRDTGISMTHIPYKGGSETAAALLGGQLDVQFGTPPSIAPVMQKVNILGSTMGKRTSLVPGVPAVSETVKGFNVSSWYAVGGPSGMPADVVTKLGTALRTAIADPKLQQQLATLGLEPAAMSSQDATTFYHLELDRWAKVVRTEGLKADD
jgi:tripartite-type tricarboxylate transporter receptor subunit TctC